MSPSRPNRCPSCGKMIDVSLLAFSAAHGAFVCPSCRRRGIAQSMEGDPTEPESFLNAPGLEAQMPRADSRDDVARATYAGVSAQPDRSHSRAVRSSRSGDPRTFRRWLLPAALAVVASLCIATILVVVFSNSPHRSNASGFSSDERAWEIANHDQIIALKSAAESLAIQGKLPEAHAKYRELEKLLGGRTVQDAQLFDIVAQARQDQDRIYALIVGKMELKQLEAKAAEGDRTAAAQLPMGVPDAAPPPGAPPATTLPSAEPEAVPRQAIAEPQVVAEPQAQGESSAASPEPALPAEQSPSSHPAQASQPARPEQSEPAPATVPQRRITDQQVGDAIHRGVDFLISQLKDGHIPPSANTMPNQVPALDALVVYSLLQSGIAINDGRLTAKGSMTDQLINKLKADQIGLSGTFNTPATYGRSLRACALATYNRPQDRKQLEDDVRWLIRASDHGGYTYDDRYAQQSRAPQRLSPELARIIAASYESSGDADGAAGADTQLLGMSHGPTKVILADGLHGPDGQEVGYHPPGAGFGNGPSAPGAGYGTPRTAPGAGYTGQGTPEGSMTGRGGGATVNINVPNGPISPFFHNALPPHPYVPPPKYSSPFPWDNSNSQYGLLGVWAGAEVGIEVPANYWRDAEQHWESSQLRTGQWNYMGDDQRGYFAMTVAGVASLFVTHDYIEAPLMTAGHVGGRDPYTPPLAAGLAWLETGNNSVSLRSEPLFYYGYNLYGLERVGLASGFKYFGTHDWYSELAADVLASQRPDGSFEYRDGGAKGFESERDIINTAYTLLFLARGRHPVMFNKLRFEDFWTNRPRDIANLARYASSELERPLNWQVVDIRRDPDDWADAPVLYIASNHPPKMTGNELAKIQAFVEEGGVLFTHSDLASESFNGWAAKLAKTLFPDYPLKELPADSPLYTLQYKIKDRRPRLMGVFNGSRYLMIHSPNDLAGAWQMRATISRKSAFELGTNIFLYAIGKEQFRNRLDTRAVPIPTETTPRNKLQVARIQYGGNWNPERGAWIRFSLLYEDRTGTRLMTYSVAPAQLDPAKYQLALLTGTDSRIPTDADLAPMRKFVAGGGVLFVEPTGGSREFAAAIVPWLEKLGAGSATTAPTTGAAAAQAPATQPSLGPLAADDPLLQRPYEGAPDLSHEKLRLYALTQLGPESGVRIKTMPIGKGRVIYSDLDISSGLLGTDTWGILGCTPDYSEALASNLVAEAMHRNGSGH